MTTLKHFLLAILLPVTLFFSATVSAQATSGLYIKITKKHRDLDLKDASSDKWTASEKEYLNKVVRKNEFIRSRDVLTHYMTEDNTETLYVEVYNSWENIAKAAKRSKELENEAWPDVNKRNAYLQELHQYFGKNESDEFFMTVPGMKEDTGAIRKPLYYQMRVNHLAFPKDGTEEEFLKLNDEFLQKSIYNNKYIKAYYPFVQVHGADKRQYIELTAVESLDAMENAFKEIDVFLYEPKKEDEARHAVFISNYFRYFTGFHGDYIYRSVPELRK
jgi:hypothetical protein